MEQKRLSWGTRIGFGIGDIGGNALFTIMAFWLMNYLTDTVGLQAALAGIALWVGKIWDAVTDPLMGYISDHTRTRWGRRRPYIFIGGILALVAMLIMFYNPHFKAGEQDTLIFVWALLAYCFLCLAFTIFNIPYSALTPDLTDDFRERTTLGGVRMFFAIIGTFLAAGAFLPVVDIFTPAGVPDKSQGYLWAGLIYGIIIMAVSIITSIVVKEKKWDAKAISGKNELFKDYLSIFKNKPYLLILFPYALNMIGTTIISQSMQYYFKYIFHAEDQTTTALVILLGAAMLFIPLWTPLVKKIGKSISYALGLFIIAVVCVVVFFCGHILGMEFVLVMMGVAGFGLAATYVAPWAMIPDTIEYDFASTQRRKEGIYYGMWTFFSKTGQALAALIGGLVLQLTNYVANALNQTPEAELGLRLLLGPIPALALALAGVIVLFYPIDEKRYIEILNQSQPS